jgi:hypothetical protein
MLAFFPVRIGTRHAARQRLFDSVVTIGEGFHGLHPNDEFTQNNKTFAPVQVFYLNKASRGFDAHLHTSHIPATTDPRVAPQPTYTFYPF